MNFLKENELKLSKKFINDGFIIKDIKNLDSLYYLRDKIIKSSTLITRDKQNEKSKFLNTIHHMVKIKELNDFRPHKKYLDPLIEILILENHFMKFLEIYLTL